jgi:hypothetical protein
MARLQTKYVVGNGLIIEACEIVKHGMPLYAIILTDAEGKKTILRTTLSPEFAITMLTKELAKLSSSAS